MFHVWFSEHFRVNHLTSLWLSLKLLTLHSRLKGVMLHVDETLYLYILRYTHPWSVLVTSISVFKACVLLYPTFSHFKLHLHLMRISCRMSDILNIIQIFDRWNIVAVLISQQQTCEKSISKNLCFMGNYDYADLLTRHVSLCITSFRSYLIIYILTWF